MRPIFPFLFFWIWMFLLHIHAFTRAAKGCSVSIEHTTVSPFPHCSYKAAPKSLTANARRALTGVMWRQICYKRHPKSQFCSLFPPFEISHSNPQWRPKEIRFGILCIRRHISNFQRINPSFFIYNFVFPANKFPPPSSTLYMMSVFSSFGFTILALVYQHW